MKRKKILITGGCGFIGTNFIEYLLRNPESSENNSMIINLDKQTYAGRGKNLELLEINKHLHYKFYKGDICNKKLVKKIFIKEKPDLVFNFAAESHVDRSIENTEDFVMTNIIGTINLLDASKKFGVEKFIQISTDEVYGDIRKGKFFEKDKLHPSSPYSSSKAAADLITLSYFETYKSQVIITRSANNYGPFQFPEKLIPLFITNLMQSKKVPLMWSPENPGLNVRDWLFVLDNCRAIYLIALNGKAGEIYNIPGENEKSNIEITRILLDHFNLGEEMIEKIEHRKGHDFRYSIDGTKLKRLGYNYKYNNLEENLIKTIEWYKKNEKWWGPLIKND